MELFVLVFILIMPNGSSEQFAIDQELSYSDCIVQGELFAEQNKGVQWECVQIDFN